MRMLSRFSISLPYSGGYDRGYDARGGYDRGYDRGGYGGRGGYDDRRRY